MGDPAPTRATSLQLRSGLPSPQPISQSMTESTITKNLKLAREWADDLYHLEFKHRVSDYVLTLDRNHVWNGYKSSLLAVKNRNLGCILVVTGVGLSSSVSEIVDEINQAHLPRISYTRVNGGPWTQHQIPPPIKWIVAAVHRLDESHVTCNLATLQPCIREASDRYVKRLLHGYVRGNNMDAQWKEHEDYLSQFQLEIHEKDQTARQLAVAKARLKQ